LPSRTGWSFLVFRSSIAFLEQNRSGEWNRFVLSEASSVQQGIPGMKRWILMVLFLACVGCTAPSFLGKMTPGGLPELHEPAIEDGDS
jgi:hypothetical protein